MMDELTKIVLSARENSVAERIHAEEVKSAWQKKREDDAKYALEVFHPTLQALGDEISFRLGVGWYSSKRPCVEVLDKSGRRFHIAYHQSSFVDRDWEFGAQWKDHTWMDYSVFTTEKKVAEQLGRWLSEV